MRESLDDVIVQMRQAGILCDEAMGAFRRAFISAALRAKSGNACKAAAAMGVHRNTLRRLCAELEGYAMEFRHGRRPAVVATRSRR